MTCITDYDRFDATALTELVADKEVKPAEFQPEASVPLHWNHAGLPVGIQLAAGFGEDELLMSLCGELETAQPWFHRRPAMVSLS